MFGLLIAAVKAVAGGALKTAAKEGLKTAAKEGIKTVAKEGVKTAAKGAVKTAAKEGIKTVAKEGVKTAAKDAGVKTVAKKAMEGSVKKAAIAKRQSIMGKAVKAAKTMAGNTNTGRIVEGGQQMVETAKGEGTPMQKSFEMGEQAVETMESLNVSGGGQPQEDGLEHAQGQGDVGQPPRTTPYFMVQDKQTGQNRVKDFGDYFEEYING